MPDRSSEAVNNRQAPLNQAAQLPSSIELETTLELVRLHANLLKRMPIIQAFLILSFWFLIASTISGQTFLLWGTLSFSVECLRAYFGRQTLKHVSLSTAREAHRRFTLLAALSGGAISISAILFLPVISVEQRAAVGFLLTGIPAAGVAVSQASRYIIGGYALAILVPASLAWGGVYPDQALGMFGLALVYSFVLMAVAADNEKMVSRSIAIRHERDRVVLELEQSNREVRVAMAQAEQAAQARARVLAAASHDLRQPLQALSVYSAILAAHPTPQTLSEVGHDIDQIVRSLGSLLGGLLDLSRLSTDYYVPEKQICALDKIVNGVCNELQAMANDKGLVLQRHLQPVSLRTDSVALGRIARNLIENAIKYTDRGEVIVETKLAPGIATLSICDTGKGIPPSELGRIFEEFYQIDNPGRDRSQGVGLGLAIVQRLCELLGTKVELESELGRGSGFHVSFVDILDTESGSVEGVLPGQDTALVNFSVYLIDDEIEIVKSMSKLLGLWGMRVLSATSTPPLDQIFVEFGKPDLLIADLRLGKGEHGAALANRLRLQYGEFPVLIISGETASEALRETKDSGYQFLQKPITPENLRKTIKHCLQPTHLETSPSGTF
jgi:two-component system, sensor histidine kinase